MKLGWRWVAMGLVAVGCGSSAMDEHGGGTMGDDVDSSSSGTTRDAEADEGVGPDETTTVEYPTQESCGDSSAGYDVPQPPPGTAGGGDSFGDEGESGSAEETGTGMVDDIPIGATVFQVRRGELLAGTWVELRDIVITSPIARGGPRDGMVFAQSPEGGPYSAIALVIPDLPSAAALAIGDRVRVRGRVGMRYVFSALFVDATDTSVVVEGSAALPTPVVLGPSDLQPGAEDVEAYESALVRVENPRVDDTPRCIGSFTLDAGVRVDDLFLGDAAPDPAAGDAFSSITGPLRYTYNGFEIAPRSASDIEP